MKQSRSKSMFFIFIIVTLLAMLVDLFPASPVQADALVAGGDFVWAKSIGGAGDESGYGITVDLSGNIYTIGQFSGTVDFDPGIITFDLTSAGDDDIFISKLDPNGNFIWAKQLGGANFDLGSAIALDPAGNVYITGIFSGTADFDPGTGTYDLTSAGSIDIFVCKLDTFGTFVWAKRMGGSSADGGDDLAVDIAGNVYTIGTFSNTADFDPGIGTFSLNSAGLEDIFVSKLDANGSFVWAKQMGGTGYDSGYSIVLDTAGNIYTTGHFRVTVDFDPGAGIFNLTSAGDYDIFISKLDMSGSLLWARRIGAASDDTSYDVAVDSTGNVYTTGFFQGTSDFDPDAGTYNLTSAGFGDIFVSKLSTNGNFVWAKGMGGVGDDQSESIGLDSAGNVYTTGYFRVTADFDPGPGTFYLDKAANGSIEMFDSKLDTNGNFVWAKGIVGTTDSANSAGKAIVVKGDESIYRTGNLYNTADFDSGVGIANLSSVVGSDIFVAKLQANSAPIFADVSLSYWANGFIERLYNAGITGGCTTVPLNYCPTTPVTRAQMAIFLLRGIYGSAYIPPAATGTVFNDVPLGTFGAAWIEQLAAEGITSGCGGGNYCPNTTVSRAQMAIFLVRAKHGSTFIPPAATGIFLDVPIGSFGANFIEQLVTDAITSGCGSGNFCPNTMVKRDSMAVFLVKIFNLP